MQSRTKTYFTDYPQSGECFETSDGFLFHHDYDAKAHARSLEDKVVVRYDRDGAVSPAMPLPVNDNVADKGIDAVAPVVVDEAGNAINPGPNDTSTSPVTSPDGEGLLDVPLTGTTKPVIADGEEVTEVPAPEKIAAKKPAKKK